MLNKFFVGQILFISGFLFCAEKLPITEYDTTGYIYIKSQIFMRGDAARYERATIKRKLGEIVDFDDFLVRVGTNFKSDQNIDFPDWLPLYLIEKTKGECFTVTVRNGRMYKKILLRHVRYKNGPIECTLKDVLAECKRETLQAELLEPLKKAKSKIEAFYTLLKTEQDVFPEYKSMLEKIRKGVTGIPAILKVNTMMAKVEEEL
ncbi:MAG TPA: hypothetical protein VEK38_03510 [Candidatus Bathyarchaeia archaeon]|nr:hypothetical protein [Candidatus Bathyarchaeia archaeon]